MPAARRKKGTVLGTSPEKGEKKKEKTTDQEREQKTRTGTRQDRAGEPGNPKPTGQREATHFTFESAGSWVGDLCLLLGVWVGARGQYD